MISVPSSAIVDKPSGLDITRPYRVIMSVWHSDKHRTKTIVIFSVHKLTIKTTFWHFHHYNRFLLSLSSFWSTCDIAVHSLTFANECVNLLAPVGKFQMVRTQERYTSSISLSTTDLFVSSVVHKPTACIPSAARLMVEYLLRCLFWHFKQFRVVI